MIFAPNNKIARDEALKRVDSGDIFHSSGFVNNAGVTGRTTNSSYQKRQEMIKKHLGDYNKSQLGAARNPGLKARAVETTTRFDAHINKRKPD